MSTHKSVRLFQAVFAGFAICVVASATSVIAQVHQREDGEYVVRANVLRADTLPPEALRRHAIEAGPGRFLLNVVVLRGGATGQKGVRADVKTNAEMLAGYDVDIDMKAVVEDGGVSYLGRFSVPPQASAIRFSVTVTPVEGRRLTLDFTEQLAARR